MIAIGGGVFFTKVVQLNFPVTPDVTDTIWDFEIYLEFDGRDEPARLEVYLPASDVERTYPQEQFYNGPFGLNLVSEIETRNRKAVWTYRFPSNRKVLRYSAKTLGENAATPLPQSFTSLKPPAQPSETDSVRRQAFIVWAGDMRRRSADNVSFANLTLAEIFGGSVDGPSSDEMGVFFGAAPTLQQKLDLARQTLESQGLPARIANGIYLSEERRRVDLRHWLEYHIDGEDYRYFPGGDPENFFTIWYGLNDLVTSTGVGELDTQISLESEQNATIEIARTTKGPLRAVNQFFSFNDLPLTTQLVYKVLVTIPVGITILVFLRQFIGIKTVGTFMPVLIGIAFRETALLNGVILFSTLVAMGLAIRFYLERLHLLLVPRLAVVLIAIIIMMAAITSLMSGSDQSIGLSISLFPMVILTMTIERMSIAWEEGSPGEAIQQGIGSLVVASITYLAMVNQQVEYLMYNFPELLFVLMGICVLMGRYTGMRLTELWRFKSLTDS